jgi:hypothetical protein
MRHIQPNGHESCAAIDNGTFVQEHFSSSPRRSKQGYAADRNRGADRDRGLHGFATMTDPTDASIGVVQLEQLTVQQTATRYWVVQRGTIELAGAVTREAAEAERELRKRLRDRRVRRAGREAPRSDDDADTSR